MRAGLLIFSFALTLGLCSCVRSTQRATLSSLSPTKTQPPNTSSEHAKVDFASQIKPILQQRCQPCHFSGGVMYERLPFDRPATIKTLGTKLFTRLKDEKEQRLIREFLDQDE